jgi:hypothetical protein
VTGVTLLDGDVVGTVGHLNRVISTVEITLNGHVYFWEVVVGEIGTVVGKLLREVGEGNTTFLFLIDELVSLNRDRLADRSRHAPVVGLGSHINFLVDQVDRLHRYFFVLYRLLLFFRLRNVLHAGRVYIRAIFKPQCSFTLQSMAVIMHETFLDLSVMTFYLDLVGEKVLVEGVPLVQR